MHNLDPQRTPHELATLARAVRLRLSRRLTRTSHAMLGFLGLWAAACGQDKQQDEQSETAALTKQLAYRPGDASRLAAPGAEVTHVIVLGDSISEGVGAEDRPLSYAELLYKNADDRYPEMQGHDLVSLFGSELTYVNVAHSGDTTIDVVQAQLPRLRAVLAEQARRGVHGVELAHNAAGFRMTGRVLVVMTVGGNDVQMALAPNPSFTGSTLSRSLLNLRSVFGFFRDPDVFAGGISPFFGNVYDVTDGTDELHNCLEGLAFPGMSEALDVWSESYATLAAQEGATLVDLLGLFRGHGFNFADPKNRYFDRRDITLWVNDRDCIHPNQRGHDKTRQDFYAQIAHQYAWGPDLGRTPATGGARTAATAAVH